MLGLLSPIWLAGLGSLFVPIALHLWSRRGGHPVRVGSIRLLAGSPPATRRSWTIQDPWLLALRCATLAALAAALAGPYWVPQARTPATHTLALVAGNVRDRDALVDSLRGAGVSVSLLDTTATPRATPNLWTALKRADRQAPPGTRFVVFAPDLLRHFRGTRPALQSRVEWQARPATTPPAAVTPSPAARVVVVFADPARLDDARYVRAALEAAGSATGIPAIVSVRPAASIARGAAVGARADWLVWLSERALPEAIREQVRRGAVLLSDAGAAAPRRHRSRIVTGAQPSDTWLRVTADPGNTGAAVWADGTGTPLLTVSHEDRGTHYRFHSRFFPGWGDFVLRPAFPLAMARLWAATDSIAAAPDERRVTIRQIIPAQEPRPRAADWSGTSRRSLFMALWVLAALLFLFERWVSR